MAGIGIQTQIRHNAEDIRNYFEDLRKWEKEMKEKERKERKTRHTPEPALPQTSRLSQQKSLERQPLPEQQLSYPRERNRTLARDENSLPAYYSAWDRFNVDEELEKIDREDVKDPGLITASSKAAPPQISRHLPKIEENNQVLRSKMKVLTRVGRRRDAAHDAEAQSGASPQSVTLEQGTQMQLLADAVAEAEANVKKALVLNLNGIEQFRQKSLRSASRAFQLAFAAMGKPPVFCGPRSAGSNPQASSGPKPAVFRHFAKLQSVVLSNDGFAQLGLSRTATALERTREAKKLWPESPFVAFLEATCSRKAGDYAAAIATLRRLEVQMRQSQRPQETNRAQPASTGGDLVSEDSFAAALQSRGTTELRKPTGEEAAEVLQHDSLDAFETEDFDGLSSEVAIYHPDSPEQRNACGTVHQRGRKDFSLTGASSSLDAESEPKALKDQQIESWSLNPGTQVASTGAEPALATLRGRGPTTKISLADRLKADLEELRALQRERQLVARKIRQRRFYEETVEILDRMQKLREEQISPLPRDINRSGKVSTRAQGDERQTAKDDRKNEVGKTGKRKSRANIDAIARTLVATPTRNLSLHLVEPTHATSETSTVASARAGAVDPADVGARVVEAKSAGGPEAFPKGKVEDESRAPVPGTPQTPGATIRRESGEGQAKSSSKSEEGFKSRILTSVGAGGANEPLRQGPLPALPSTSPLPVTFFSFVQQWKAKCRHQVHFNTEEGDDGLRESTKLASALTAGASPENRGRAAFSSVQPDDGSEEQVISTQPPRTAEPVLMEESASRSSAKCKAKATMGRKVCPICTVEKGILLERLATSGVIGRLFGASLEADILAEILGVLLDLLAASENSASAECTAVSGDFTTCDEMNATRTTVAGSPNWSLSRVKQVIAEVLTQLCDGQTRFWSLLYQLEPDELESLKKAIGLFVDDVAAEKAAGKYHESSAFSKEPALSEQTPRTNPKSSAQKQKLLEQIHHRLASWTCS
ncbi:conserved hypothetical protein [Neospora caninum Liverpool]|uniref:RNA polymerase II-associated protein 3 n=1 Tax=Neospora caninum (strain Liverpool) TaxID=572307 RepID=F0VQ18_NEOCL|nr:conserved hypothetical protein [Neospora caninum Liverpool]CBZ55815.1 conserved hypothetical protein [Neospora caninum Liverpool]CEL70557.1 TPA: RNA polymerase II-associated protein 3 [Neospora caninum Liverpool]|eukprot:XP_003885841.1 conserved hypothetical protein [Neospora caninum Liverpool]